MAINMFIFNPVVFILSLVGLSVGLSDQFSVEYTNGEFVF